MLLRHGATLTAAALLVAALAGGCGGGEETMIEDGKFDAERAFTDLEAQVAIGPRPSGSAGNREEVALIVDRLERAGTDDVAVQRPYRNVVGTIPGREPGTVIVGAHHDTKDAIPGLLGANDGASGVAVVLELARALPSRLDGPSVQLVLFDAEEPRGAQTFEADGSRGSRQYVEYARDGSRGSVPLDEVRAMVLFDLVGDCDLQIPLEANSDAALYARFADAATELTGEVAPFEGTAAPIGDDHVPFTEEGVPAVDLIDFAYGPGPSPGPYWHTSDDTLERVCPESLETVGEAALAAIPEIR